MPEMSSKNQPQLVYMSMAWRCISRSLSAVALSAAVKLPPRVSGDKPSNVFRRSIEDDVDVAIAGGPGIVE